MADHEGEEPPTKVPRILKEKADGKRLILILENASLETVKVELFDVLNVRICVIILP